MSNQTDRDIIDALLRQMDPYNTPQGSPDVLAQLGARLESAGTQLEGSLQGRNELERMAELIPRWLAANPMQEAGALLQMRQPEVEQLKTMARQAAADPMGTAEAVGRAGVGAIKDPLGTAEKLSLPDIMGGGKALASLGRMGRKLRGPDLIESVMPEAKVERPRTLVEAYDEMFTKPRIQRNKDLLQESLDRGEVPGEKWEEALWENSQAGTVSQIGFDDLPEIEKARLDRAVEQGFNIDAFHGTKGDIREFDPGLLGATTGAPSARLGFFFSADEKTAAKYAQDAETKMLRPEYQGQWEDLAEKFNAANVKANTIRKRKEKEITVPIDQRLSEIEKELNQLQSGPSEQFDNDIYEKLSQEHFDLSEQRIHEITNIKNDPEYDIAARERAEIKKGMDDFDKQGANILPTKLRLSNPLVYDFKGSSYRESSYHDLLQKAKAEGHDGAIFRNTTDGAGVTDIYVVLDPSQIRSSYAMFDPKYEPRMSLSDDAPIAQNLMDEWDEKLPKLETEKSELEQKWMDQWKQLELLEDERSTAEKSLRQGEKMRMKWYQENTDNLDQWGNYSKSAADIERLSAGDRSLYDEFMRKHESMESNMSKLSNNYNQSVDAIEELENRQAAISTQLPKLTEEIEFIKKEYPLAKGKTQPQISGTGDILAGAAPVVLPLGAGAAAEAYLANQEQ